MVRTGTVVCEHDDGTLDVQFLRPEACEKCGMCAEGHARCHNIRIKGRASVGDEVDLEMDDNRISLASIWAYVLPCICLLGGLAISVPLYGMLNITMNNEIFSALCAFVALAIALVFLRVIDPIFKREKWQPKIIAARKVS